MGNVTRISEKSLWSHFSFATVKFNPSKSLDLHNASSLVLVSLKLNLGLFLTYFLWGKAERVKCSFMQFLPRITTTRIWSESLVRSKASAHACASCAGDYTMKDRPGRRSDAGETHSLTRSRGVPVLTSLVQRQRGRKQLINDSITLLSLPLVKHVQSQPNARTRPHAFLAALRLRASDARRTHARI